MLDLLFLSGFDVDIAPDNFVDRPTPAAAPNEPGVGGGGVATPTPGPIETSSAGTNEEDPTLGPPTAKKPRLEAKTTLTTLHPVSELTQKYQGAMFEFTGMAK